MAASTWRAYFADVQRALPKNATFHERGQATKHAAAMWRKDHGGSGSNPARVHRSRGRHNPQFLSGGLNVAGHRIPYKWLIGGGLVALVVAGKSKASAASDQPQGSLPSPRPNVGW